MVEAHLAAVIEPPDRRPTVAEAADLCLRLARTHYENFAVLSWLTPRRMRVHVAALYAYCRTVDDLGDEAAGDRAELLDRFEAELGAAYRGAARHPVLVALERTIETFALPEEPFRKLIEANRIDQTKRRYATFAELLDYCDHSANPVGRLFLHLFGYRDEERLALSDATCTALQLTNFWQDVRRDHSAGRIYLPEDDRAAWGVSEADLLAATATDELRGLIESLVERTRDYFRKGLPLLDRVRGRLWVDLALFSRGGLAILEKLEEQRWDPLKRRPVLSGGEKLGLFAKTLVLRDWERWIER